MVVLGKRIQALGGGGDLVRWMFLFCYVCVMTMYSYDYVLWRYNLMWAGALSVVISSILILSERNTFGECDPCGVRSNKSIVQHVLRYVYQNNDRVDQ